jgi:histidinol-phosphate/aromatic aminotransferase/cobyric acid decarboxylase-like protein
VAGVGPGIVGPELVERVEVLAAHTLVEPGPVEQVEGPAENIVAVQLGPVERVERPAENIVAERLRLEQGLQLVPEVDRLAEAPSSSSFAVVEGPEAEQQQLAVELLEPPTLGFATNPRCGNLAIDLGRKPPPLDR